MDHLTKGGERWDQQSKPNYVPKAPQPGCEPPFGCDIYAIADARSYSRLMRARTGYMHTQSERVLDERPDTHFRDLPMTVYDILPWDIPHAVLEDQISNVIR